MVHEHPFRPPFLLVRPPSIFSAENAPLFSIDFFFTTIIVAKFVPIVLGWFINPQKSNRLIAECSFLFIFFRPTFLSSLF